jgi:uncharacterized protein YqcC (DUF446 family)
MVFTVTSSKTDQLACNLASQSWWLKEVPDKHHFAKVTPFFDEIGDFTNSSWMSKWNFQDTSMVLDITSSKTHQLARNLASQSWQVKEIPEKHNFKKVNPFFDEIRAYTNSSWMSKWNFQDTSMVLDVTSSKIHQLACNVASQSWLLKEVPEKHHFTKVTPFFD